MSQSDDERRALDEVWEQRGDKAYKDITEKPVRTGIKWTALGLGGTIALITALVIVIGAISYVLSIGSTKANAVKAKATAGARVTILTYDPRNIAAAKAKYTSACADVTNAFDQWQAAQTQLTQFESQLKQGLVQDPTGATLEQYSSQESGDESAVYSTAAAYDATATNTIYNKFAPAGFPRAITPPASHNLTNWTPPACG